MTADDGSDRDSQLFFDSMKQCSVHNVRITVFPVKPWTPQKISAMFIVSRPIRCEMKPQKITGKAQNGLITTWHETTSSLLLPRRIFNWLFSNTEFLSLRQDQTQLDSASESKKKWANHKRCFSVFVSPTVQKVMLVGRDWWFSIPMFFVAKGLFTWRWGTPGRWGTPPTCGKRKLAFTCNIYNPGVLGWGYNLSLIRARS